ncbi:MAG: biopolymer transporter ExbD [Lautropia sp.]|nr:biopolymer transporter ExbD [Lautropia sp.]
MNFRRAIRRDEPEINFIPLIDLLLVILIFLMVTTTYNRFRELAVDLPSASGKPTPEQPLQILVAVTAEGHYRIDQQSVGPADIATLAAELGRVAADKANPVIVIYADAAASHQAVVNVLESARVAGLPRVSFATQTKEAP